MNKSILFAVVICFVSLPLLTKAATISLSPATGVYSAGSTFTARVQVDTSGKPINAADGTLTFNPKELSVVSVSKGSVFSLWTAEPSYSNSAGTVSFSGGSPTGYTGSAGTVLSVTFRVLSSGTSRVSLTGGSVLAADGRGTNVLTGMSGGTYTLSAVTSQPEPEVIVEYVPPQNTPAAPKVTSSTHADSAKWYTGKTANLSWQLPADVTAVRTLIDANPNSVPTKIYDTPISSLTLSDLEEGVSYFHIQFTNADGWGRVTHYKIAIDTKKPDDVIVKLPENNDSTSPKQKIIVELPSSKQDSPIEKFNIQIPGRDLFTVTELKNGNEIELPDLEPGYHMLVIEVVDAAGNAAVTNLSITVEAFEKPTFTDTSSELPAGIVPVFRGSTRAEAEVTITVTEGSTNPTSYTVKADAAGVFTFIPDSKLKAGVYTLTAQAIDKHGAKSSVSDEYRFVAKEPGYLVIGSIIVNALSLVVTILSLAGLLVVLVWFSLYKLLRLSRKVKKESDEVAAALEVEFSKIRTVLEDQKNALSASRKAKKLTKAEEELIAAVEATLSGAKQHVEKEVADVQLLVKGKKK